MYETAPELAGQAVTIRYSPFDLTQVEVFHRGASRGRAQPHAIRRHCHPKVKQAPQAVPAVTGIDYLQLLEDKRAAPRKRLTTTTRPPPRQPGHHKAPPTPPAGPFPSPVMPTQHDADMPNQRVAEQPADCEPAWSAPLPSLPIFLAHSCAPGTRPAQRPRRTVLTPEKATRSSSRPRSTFTATWQSKSAPSAAPQRCAVIGNAATARPTRCLPSSRASDYAASISSVSSPNSSDALHAA